MTASNDQAYGNSNWGKGRGNGPGDQGPWGNFHWGWGSLPPWMPPHAAKPLLIVAMILGFVFWWPIGLLLLAVLIMNKRACGWGYHGGWRGGPRQWGGPGAGSGPGSGGGWQRWTGGTPPSSGNHAFDEYRTATLRRLEEEQKEFGAFLDRLRYAKDKAEFDQFMNERRDRPAEPPPAPEQPSQH